MDDLFQLIVAGLVLLYWLFGGKRKAPSAKKPSPRWAPTQTKRTPASTPAPERPQQQPPIEAPGSLTTEKLEELGELLGLEWEGQVEPERQPEVEAAAPLPVPAAEAGPPPRPPPPRTPHRAMQVARVERVRRPPPPEILSALLTPRTLREAIVLREILGPPKALE